DAGTERFRRAAEFDRLAAVQDRAAVALVDAHEDGKEGRLAGAVAAAKRVHRAGFQLEAAVTKRGNAAEGFFQSLHFQKWLHAFLPAFRTMLSHRIFTKYVYMSTNVNI